MLCFLDFLRQLLGTDLLFKPGSPEIRDEKGRGGQCPADGVAQDQHIQAVPPVNDEQNPQHPEGTDTDAGDQGGHQGIASAPHGAAQDLHGKQHHTEGNGPKHNIGANLDDLRIGGIDPQQRFPENGFQSAEDTHDGKTHGKAGPHTFVDAVIFSGTEVLPYKGGDSHTEGTADHPDDGIGFDVGDPGSGGHITKGVDTPLGQNIGKVKGDISQTCRDTDDKDPAEGSAVECYLFKTEAVLGGQAAECNGNQYRADALGQHRCQGGTGHAHVPHHYKQGIQYNIDHTGGFPYYRP